MAIRWKDKIMEGVVIGLTTSIIVIFVTFLWTQALQVSTVMTNVEDKIEEVVGVFNESNEILNERLLFVEDYINNNQDHNIPEQEPISYEEFSIPEMIEEIPEPIPTMAPAPTPVQVYEELPQMEQRQLPRLDQYQRSWK